MRNDSRDHETWLTAALALLVGTVLLVGGCAATSLTPTQRAEAQAHIATATQAIGAGDLEQARTKLTLVEPFMSDETVGRQVRSLEQLMAGVDALDAGDVAGARQHWEAIEDPYLANEVQAKAREIGLTLSVRSASVESAGPR